MEQYLGAFLLQNHDGSVLTEGLSPCECDKNIPELYQKAMLWKDWKEASKGQRR